jgi:hypothetical protein
MNELKHFEGLAVAYKGWRVRGETLLLKISGWVHPYACDTKFVFEKQVQNKNSGLFSYFFFFLEGPSKKHKSAEMCLLL